MIVFVNLIDIEDSLLAEDVDVLNRQNSFSIESNNFRQLLADDVFRRFFRTRASEKYSLLFFRQITNDKVLCKKLNIKVNK